MRKLTATDIQELTAYFMTIAPVGAATGLAAQSYEPGGGSTYTPVTDTRLVRLCEGAKRLATSDWARMKRVVDQMLDAPGGDGAVRTLRLACSDPSAGWPEIACRTPTAMKLGRQAAEDQERHDLLQGVHDATSARGQSPMTVAMRVLEADRRLYVAGVRVDDAKARLCARRLIANGKGDLDAVTQETGAIVDAAAKALRAARDQVGASARKRREAEEQRRRDFRAELRADREAKETARFEARLRRVG